MATFHCGISRNRIITMKGDIMTATKKASSKKKTSKKKAIKKTK